MTLDQYLANGLPTYADANQYALVMSEQLKDNLLAAQDSLPPSQNRVVPTPLTDGRWLLRAALLTEIGEGGMFQAGFSALNPQLFPMVEVVPWADVVGLLPQEEV